MKHKRKGTHNFVVGDKLVHKGSGERFVVVSRKELTMTLQRENGEMIRELVTTHHYLLWMMEKDSTEG